RPGAPALRRVTVRRAILADAAGIAEVQTRAWFAAYDGIVERTLMEERVTGREDRWRETLSGGARTWVAVGDGRILGFVSADRSRDDDAAPLTGEIWALYVDPVEQRRGVGWALMDTALDALRASGCRTASLWVFAANGSARAFYERVGWTHDGGPAKDDLWAPEVRYRRAL
ncbi:MAG: acetyltransferase, partial [Solirubrobacterales bacterium]|nr:acetyltransferase [Solirubrobacterales bacterium]